MTETLNSLARAAGIAASQGRWNDAEQLWKKVRALDPRHAMALYSLGMHAFQRGQLNEALDHLKTANRESPNDPVVLLSIGAVLREQGDSAGELKAIEAALAVEPYFLGGLLAKAAHLERHGRPRAAAESYENALKVAPPEPQWPAALRGQLLHARVQVENFGRAFASFLEDQVGSRFVDLPKPEAQRWREAIAIQSGQSRPYQSHCTRLHVPRLPAVPFFEREHFDWVQALESKTEAITAELNAVLAKEQAEFKPYVAYAPGTPVNQWKDLNHSRRWSSYFLWRNGQPVTEHLEACPETARALAAVDMADIGGLCPNAMFSALAPHTHIPPHQGETNARLIVHLPLVVPDHCLYRVGFEQRRWKTGEVLIFDDSIEHEARNDSDQLRVVLIFDVWNPLLSPQERQMVKALSAASQEFRGSHEHRPADPPGRQ